MSKQNKSLCIFIHFSEQQDIPYYVQIYVNELARNFDEVVLLTNNRSSDPHTTLLNNVSITCQENEGYDFGRFYNYFKTLNKGDFYRIACVNDSNVLINNLDKVLRWEDIDHFDFWGLVDSHEKPWFSTHSDNYHIQSHFMVFHKKAIDLLDGYFSSVEMEKIFHEINPKLLRRKVIDNWEIGLSQFMISANLKIGHFIDSKAVTKHFNIRYDSNISHILYEELVRSGYPLLKKKVIFDQKRKFWRSGLSWQTLIRKYSNPLWNPDKLIEELEHLKNAYLEKRRSRFVNKIILHLQRKSFTPYRNRRENNL